MEGISHEACSLAGTLGLGKLIVFYDDNGISIDGKVSGWFADDTPKRFEAYGWHVMPHVDGHDAEAVEAAMPRPRGRDRPAVADLLQDHHRLGRAQQAGHRGRARRGAGRRGGGRGAQDARAGPTPPFEVPDEMRAGLGSRARPGARPRRSWQRAVRPLRKAHPGAGGRVRAAHARASCRRTGQTRRAQTLEAAAQADRRPQATRQSSQAALNVLGPALPELLGGSADLTALEQHAAQGLARHDAARTPAATTCITACASSA